MKTQKIEFNILSNNPLVRKTLKTICASAMLAAALVSCEMADDVDVVDIDVPLEISGEELVESILDRREDAQQTFVIDASSWEVIIGDQGTNVVFGANSLEFENGDPVTGDVDVTLIEIYNKADMVLSKLPTNGMNENGDVETILSAGEFHINATQNGEQLKLNAPYQIFAPNDTFDPEMTIFTPIDDCIEIDCDVVWEEEEDGELFQGEGMGIDGTPATGYTAFTDNFGWTNLDRWGSYTGPKTIVYADVPEGYNADNSAVYISYDGETGLALLDIYVEDDQLFSEHYGQMPIGKEVHFIFISVQNGSYVYAIQAAIIGDDHIEVITTTQTATEAELFALIDALP